MLNNDNDYKDLTGSRFGKLTVISFESTPSRSITGIRVINRWLCGCECGCEVRLSTGDLTSGSRRSCSAPKCRFITNDHAGERFGSLTVVKRAYPGTKNYKSELLDCICDCGAHHITRIGTLKRSKYPSCGCYGVRQRVMGALFRYYRHSASNRSLPFNLDQEKFNGLVLSDCFYCGQQPMRRIGRDKSNAYRMFVNGVDRIDSSRGYELDNVLPCCETCNKMKMDMGLEQFMDLCVAIANRKSIIDGCLNSDHYHNGVRIVHDSSVTSTIIQELKGYGSITRAKHYLGYKFGALTVLSVSKNTNKNGSIIDCVCECGGHVKTTLASLRKSVNPDCGCRVGTPDLIRFTLGMDGTRSYYTLLNNLRLDYIASARHRKFEFTLDPPEFYKLVLSDCLYCGRPPQRLYKKRRTIGEVMVNGLDRVDSGIGYVDGNVVPACKECNYMKLNTSLNHFLLRCVTIAERHLARLEYCKQIESEQQPISAIVDAA